MTNTIKIIQINYDLCSSDRNYYAVGSYIQSQGDYTHPLQSQWFVATNKTASQIRDEIANHIGPRDAVLVVDVTGAMWASTFANSTTEWMQAHL